MVVVMVVCDWLFDWMFDYLVELWFDRCIGDWLFDWAFELLFAWPFGVIVLLKVCFAFRLFV